MPRFEIAPGIEIPDALASQRTFALWQAMRDQEPVGDYFTEDYVLEGTPLGIAMLPQGHSGNEEALAHADRIAPEAVIRLQDVVAGPSDTVMSVLAVSPGEGEHGFVIYIVSELTGDRFSRTLAFTDLREAREALGV